MAVRTYKVYVGNLGENGRKEEIEKEFERFGRLHDVWVARNPPGFAFVEFEDLRDAEDAIKELDGKHICGARVRVEMSRHRGGRGRGGGGGHRGDRGGGRRFDDRNFDRFDDRSRSPYRFVYVYYTCIDVLLCIVSGINVVVVVVVDVSVISIIGREELERYGVSDLFFHSSLEI